MQNESLEVLGRWLQGQGYRFTTVTPATHGRVNRRPSSAKAQDLRGVFGWSRPFAAALLPADMLALMREGGLLALGPDGDLASTVRFSSIGELLFAHSAYPTTQADAVFFGPDTVRFTALIEGQLHERALPVGARILDVGCGAGPGGIVAALAAIASAPRLVLADINPAALDHARANAALAGLERVEFAQGDLFGAVEGDFDLVVANPPYLNDAAQRAYRHGGGAWGGGLSERIVREGLPRLAPGGRLVLYTGAAIVEGSDPLLDALRPELEHCGWSWSYRELDPDVFGEELEEPAYAGADRIAAVALVVGRPRP
ncbi:MAG: methyltransferase domain-containing protein [Comamonadaceae bacterium]|nr:MAG: methyltransferase domain-containing protein [Comamonadaceae bacterium]